MTSAVGCSNCTKKGAGGGGCAEHKGPQRVAIAATLQAVYPSGRWGELDDEAAFGRGSDLGATRRLAFAIAAAARAPVEIVPGQDGDHCHFLYVLCVGRQPALVELRQQGGLPEAEEITEQYLRVVVSTIAKVASVQEAQLVWRDGLLTETARPGVYDPKLLRRMRAVVATIEAHGLEHLDFGLVDVTAELDGSEYEARYGVPAKIVNYLYYAQPVDLASHALLDGLGASAGAQDEPWLARDEHRQERVEPGRREGADDRREPDGAAL